MIILQGFVLKKHLFLRDFASVHPEIAHTVHPRVHFFKIYSFKSCFPTIPLNRAKLKHGTMKLKAYEKLIWITGSGVIYLLKLKGSF